MEKIQSLSTLYIILALVIGLTGCAKDHTSYPDSDVYSRVIKSYNDTYPADNDNTYYYYNPPRQPNTYYAPPRRRPAYPQDNDASYVPPRKDLPLYPRRHYPSDNDAAYIPPYPQDNDAAYVPPRHYSPYPKDNDHYYVPPRNYYSNDSQPNQDADMNYIYPLYLD